MILILCLMFFTTVRLFLIGLSMRPASFVMIQDRIQDLASGEPDRLGDPAGDRERRFSERVIRPMLVQLSRLIMRLTPEGQTDTLQRRLDAAGNPPRLGVREFLGLRVLSAAGGFLFAVVVYRLMEGVSTPVAIICACWFY